MGKKGVTKGPLPASPGAIWGSRLGLSVDSLASAIFADVGGPLCERALGLLMKKEYLALVNLDIKPEMYECPHKLRDDYMAVSLLSKYPYFETGVDLDSVALEKFQLAENSCLETNLRLMSVVHCGRYGGHDATEAILYSARKKISRLLRSFSWDRCLQYMGFGPGGTVSTPKRRGDSYYKFGDKKPTTTLANLGLAYAAIAVQPTWFRHVTGFTGKVTPGIVRELAWYADEFFTIVPGNKIITVPKNAKTNRTIAKEPLMNSYVQKGIGGFLRWKLRQVGIDLNDQTPNQRAALEGSITGALATLDLKAASDSVSIELCRLLLPQDLFAAIEMCRSPVGVLPDGTQIRYQKVSSMGCGFTFELESLIFWAICSACIEAHGKSDTRLLVYGDDLVFSVDVYPLIVEVLSDIGFTANADKSFASGWFRESCGKHYFRGVDVTPVYISKNVDSVEKGVIYANELRCWAVSPVYGLDARMKRGYDMILTCLPRLVRKYRMPYQSTSIRDGIKTNRWATSGALVGDFDECRPTRASECLGPYGKKRFPGYEGFVGSLMSVSNKCTTKYDVPYFLRQLASVSGEGGVGSAGVPTPMRVYKHISNVLYQQWPSYGPWT